MRIKLLISGSEQCAINALFLQHRKIMKSAFVVHMETIKHVAFHYYLECLTLVVGAIIEKHKFRIDNQFIRTN